MEYILLLVHVLILFFCHISVMDLATTLEIEILNLSVSYYYATTNYKIHNYVIRKLLLDNN